MSDLRSLPKVDTLARSEALAVFPERLRTEAARAAIEILREQMKNGQETADPEDLAVNHALSLTQPKTKRVLNASGVILHTGGGRARLAKEAVEAIARVAANHSAIEIDLETGARGDRQLAVKDLLTNLTGAEDAFVVNNCAAAVLLTLTALCEGADVVLSRGQMVEIGGSFRLPEVIRESGCRLVEIGCTNKTHRTDYEKAAPFQAGAILRCHPSNYKIVGFTEEPSPAELAKIANERGCWFIDDVGSGCLVDTSLYGLPKEPTVIDSLKAGAHVVTCSGDKLLGGPQAGIILGSKKAIDIIRKHPLARAVRIDKLTLAGLEATLKLYRFGEQDKIPTIAYMSKSAAEVKQDAEHLSQAFPGDSKVEKALTEVGGGSIPGEGIETFCAVLSTDNAAALAKKLRMSDPAVLSRVKDGKVWLDPRTLDPEEVGELAGLLKSLKV